jgi:hypothetical protein
MYHISLSMMLVRAVVYATWADSYVSYLAIHDACSCCGIRKLGECSALLIVTKVHASGYIATFTQTKLSLSLLL